MSSAPNAPAEPASPLGRVQQLARNLVSARGAHGLTQHRLARRSRVSRATIAPIEASASDPRLETLDLLAGALGVSPLHLPPAARELRPLAEADGALATFAAPGDTGRSAAEDVADRSREIVDSAGAAVRHPAAAASSSPPGRTRWSARPSRRDADRIELTSHRVLSV